MQSLYPFYLIRVSAGARSRLRSTWAGWLRIDSDGDLVDGPAKRAAEAAYRVARDLDYLS
jgi:hypothetical protein